MFATCLRNCLLFIHYMLETCSHKLKLDLNGGPIINFLYIYFLFIAVHPKERKNNFTEN